MRMLRQQQQQQKTINKRRSVGDHPMRKKKSRAEKNMADPFSHLPDPIVHHVMSFLTNQEITRISVLSKRFFSLWSSYPVIEFDQAMFLRSCPGIKTSYNTTSNVFSSSYEPFINAFINHIHNSMSRRGKMDTVISEFRIKANLLGMSDFDSRLDPVILMALENGVTCMDLYLGSMIRYSLPHNFASIWIKVLRLQGMTLDLCYLIQVCPSLQTVSLSSCQILHDANFFSSETLTDIEFHGCSVKLIKLNAPNLHSFSFDSCNKLRTNPCEIDVSKCRNMLYLSLNNVTSGRDWIEKLVDTLGKLKTFILNGCNDIQGFRVWNESLERLEIGNCPLLESVDLVTQSLISFVYDGTGRAMLCNISFIVSKYIEDLSIENALITDQWLETQVATLKCLESLSLKACSLLKNIKIFHENLRNFELCKCLNIVEADIDTPEVVSFTYQGGVIELCKLVTKSTCNATLSMLPLFSYNKEAYYRWRNMLSYFGHCHSLKLICSFQMDLMIPEELREELVSPLYDMQHMEIQIETLQKIDWDLVDSLLWLSPIPDTLRIFSNRTSLQMIIKFAYEEKLGDHEEEDKDPFCCIKKPIKCWKHSLTRVEIHSSDASLKNGSTELQRYFNAKTKMPVCFVSA